MTPLETFWFMILQGQGQLVSFTAAHNILGCEKFMLSLLGQVAEPSGDKAGDLLGREQRTCEK